VPENSLRPGCWPYVVFTSWHHHSLWQLLFIKNFPRTHRHFVKSCFLVTLVLKVRNPRRFLTGVMCHFLRAHQEHLSKQKLAFIVGFGSGGIAYHWQNSQQSKMLAKAWVRTHNPKKGNVCDFRTPKVWKKIVRASGTLWQWCVWCIVNIPNISLHKKLKKWKPLANANVSGREMMEQSIPTLFSGLHQYGKPLQV